MGPPQPSSSALPRPIFARNATHPYMSVQPKGDRQPGGGPAAGDQTDCPVTFPPAGRPLISHAPEHCAGVSLRVEDFNLFRFRMMAVLLALGLAAGCKAQPSTSADPGLNRRIEVMVRSQFSIPSQVDVTLGQRAPSSFAGYDSLPVTLSSGSRMQVVDFLISKDNKTLARLETFDLDKNPALSIDVQGRPIRGNPNAKVTVINFDDLECPYCARMHQELFPATLEHYKDTVRFVYKAIFDRPASLGDARGGRRQLPGGAERNRVLDLCGLPAYPRAGGHRPRSRSQQELRDSGPHRAPGSHVGQAGRRQAGRMPGQAGRDRDQGRGKGSGCAGCGRHPGTVH